MDLIEGLKNRRSYKFPYENKPVEKELLNKCIKLSMLAPSAHNSQPWRYIVLEDIVLRTKLINEMNEKLRTDLKKDGKTANFIENKVKKTREPFLNSPVLILACMSSSNLDKYGDPERKNNEFVLGVLSVASSITYLLVTLHESGLASCWYSAPLFAREIFAKILDLPEDFYPLAFITVGYPSDKGVPQPDRVPIDSILFFNSLKKR